MKHTNTCLSGDILTGSGWPGAWISKPIHHGKLIFPDGQWTIPDLTIVTLVHRPADHLSEDLI
jgi:hypothetical protein